MKLINTSIEGLFLVYPKIITDERGYFEKLYSKKALEKNNLIANFVDTNHSKTFKKGTFRGFHYQTEPMDEIKFIRCLRGKINDYVIDMRKKSKTFLEVINIELSEYNQAMLYIPAGLAHGFQALENNTEVIYMSSNYYSSIHEKVINCKDDLFKIKFEIEPIVSQKDAECPFIGKNLEDYAV